MCGLEDLDTGTDIVTTLLKTGNSCYKPHLLLICKNTFIVSLGHCSKQQKCLV